MAYNKYHNKRSEKYGRKWDSDMELDYFEGVCLNKLESGEWVDVQTQITFELQEKFEYRDKKILPIKYKADFVITTDDGELIIVDVKGIATTEFKLKWKMMKYKYPQYTYLCLQGRGRDKRKGINHYTQWINVKGV